LDNGAGIERTKRAGKLKRSVKVVKKAQRPKVKPAAKVVLVGTRNSSKGIKSWVAEFRQRDQTKSLPAFDSLFKNEQPNTDNAE